MPQPPQTKEQAALTLLLVPDVQAASDALARDGSTPFAIRVPLTLSNVTGSIVTVTSERIPLAFPRWTAWLSNTSGTAVRTSAYLMLGD